MRRWIFVLGLGLLVGCVPNNSGPPQAAPKTAAVKPIGNLSDGSPSKASGEVVLTDIGNGKTRLSVNIKTLSANTKHLGHIHVGTCAAVGPVAVALPVLSTDGSGSGSVNAELELAKLPAQIYVAYHQRAPDDSAGIGSFVACVEIPK